MRLQRPNRNLAFILSIFDVVPIVVVVVAVVLGVIVAVVGVAAPAWVFLCLENLLQTTRIENLWAKLMGK